MIDRSRKVILLVDYDNLQICASRDTPGRDLQLEPIVQLAQRYGTVMAARAYAEWNLSTERLAVYRSGMEPAFAPVLRTESDRTGKSLADTVMVAEAMDMLWTLQPDVLVLATSDKDLIPLVRVAKQRGTRVVILGSDFTAIPLREMADEHVTYKQLITDGAARAAEGAVTRQIPVVVEPRSRGREIREREPREREVREPRTQRAAAPAVAPIIAPPAATVERIASSEAMDAEGGLAGRRRRRRGSRRRGEGLVAGAEGQEAGTGEDAVDVFEASSGVAEGLPTDLESGSAEPAVNVEGSATPTEAELPPVAAEGDAAPIMPQEDAPVVDLETLETPPSIEVEQPAALTAPEGEAAPLNGEVSGDEAAAPVRRTRARRVASASRGRSRPADRG